MCCQCLRLFLGSQGSGVEENESKAAVIRNPESVRTVALASASHRGICSEDTPAESAWGFAYGEVDISTNGHTSCVAT